MAFIEQYMHQVHFPVAEKAARALDIGQQNLRVFVATVQVKRLAFGIMGVTNEK